MWSKTPNATTDIVVVKKRIGIGGNKNVTVSKKGGHHLPRLMESIHEGRIRQGFPSSNIRVKKLHKAIVGR